MGSDTPSNKVLRGMVSDPAEQSSAGYHTLRNNFKYKYFREFETEFKNILGYEFKDYMGSIRGQTKGRKSHATVPLKY